MKTVLQHKASITLLTLASIFILALFCSSEHGDAGGLIEPDQCCRCHFDVCDQTTTKPYVHAPVIEHNCVVCHIQDSANNGSKAVTSETAKINWFAKHHNPDTQHWFELPANAEGLTLSLRAKSENSRALEQDLIIPQLADIPQFPQPQEKTTISDIRVIEVKRGVFISARVSWKTDQITDTRLLYGQGNLQSSTASDSQWTKNHTMTISGLERNRNYMVAVAVRDIFGNETVSSPVPFSTRQFFTTPGQQVSPPPGKIKIGTQFLKDKNRIFTAFASNQDVTMKLGFRAGQSPTTGIEKKTATLPSQHLALTDPYTLTITACINCHPKSIGKLSHPVDVLPKKGMVIPPDYHTLADGRLTCMSCHTPHAANDPYRLTRSKRKALCLGCHLNF